MKKILDKIQGAIFDLDGTLLDSMWVWDEVDIEFLGKRGFEVPLDYTKAIEHMDADSTAKYTIERFHLQETVEDIVAEWFEMAKDKYAHEIECKPYAYECVKQLHDMGIKIAIATSSDVVLFDETLRRTGLRQWIDAVVMVKEVARGKAYPDVYLEAARRIGTTPQNTLVFEDILTGIQGAKKGGFVTVAVKEERSKEEEQSIRKECHYYVESFSELL